MAAAPRDRDTRLGPLKDARSLDRVACMPRNNLDDEQQMPPELRGDGWGRVRQGNTAASSSWNTGNGNAAVGFTGTTNSGGAGWDTAPDDGWPTVKSEKKGTDRDTSTTDDDATTEKGGSPRSKYSRLYAFNAKISQQPCSCLIQVFGSNEDTKLIQISKDSDYTVWEVEESVSRRKDTKFKFVGLFTNPVGGEPFIGGRSGGDWKGAQYEVVEVPSIDGKTVMLPCYSSKANARHAAAARAIDCISFRTTDGEETYGMCIDQPYMDPAEAPSLPMSAPVSPGTRADEMVAENEESDRATTCSRVTVAATAGTAGRNVPLPKAQLQQYYQERFLDFESIGKYFFSFDNGDDQHKLHTSVFINPTNGTERFGCGRFVGNGKSPSYETTSEDADGSDGSIEVVWYKKKKDAEHAAAARALDCIRLRESDPPSFPKLCSETPLNTDAAPLLPLRFQLEIETLMSEDPIPVISNRKVRPMPMETEAEVAQRQEYRLSRMP